MDETRFDALTRHAGTRRGVVGGLLGGSLAALLALVSGNEVAAKKRCGRGKKQCGGKCIGRGKTCCANEVCPTGKICRDRVCVVGQGTCPRRAEHCNTRQFNCGSDQEMCICLQSIEGAKRCSRSISLSEVNPCGSTRQCEARHPDVPGAFCAVLGGAICVPGNQCFAPCPASVYRP